MSARDGQTPFSPSGFFAFRTPLLPFDELLAWSQDLEAPSALGDPIHLGQALAADRVRLRARLRAVLMRPEARDAVFVASPDLYDNLDRWATDPDSERSQKAEPALVRYFQRMARRCTPFGLFAGCSVGTLGDRTHLAVVARASYQRHTRLDMDFLFALADVLERDPAVRSALTYRPNSSLYDAAGRVRYAEARLNGKLRAYHLVAVDANDYLAATLARARPGARPAALAAALVESDPEISLAEAGDYINALIDNQILVSELTLAVTGPEPIHDLLAQLRELPAAAAVVCCLEQILAALEGIDTAGPGVDAERYRAVARHLEELPAKVELARLFQVDLVKPAVQATLGPEPLAEIVRGVEILHRLARRPRQDALARFREAFVARYEGREVPLVEVLDEEVGIGFEAATGPKAEASPLLEGLTFPANHEATVSWGRREACLVRKFAETLAHGDTEMGLEPGDLDELAEPAPLPLPDAFAMMATLSASCEAAVARGDFQVLLSAGSGPSGARLLGRFCHADPVLRQHVEQHLRAEEPLDPDAIYAEVVHLPEGRVGNVLCRPVLRDYEIPYLGRSGAPLEGQIPITDLLVSVVGGQIILRSARLGRRVIPRLTSAHNFISRALGIYKFLGALQNQGVVAGIGWDWGVLESAPFLPRVVSGRLVLSRARWLMTRDELRELGEAQGAARYGAVQTWRANRRLPRFILLQDADNELPVDLDNTLSVEAFIDVVKGRSQATLVEMFPGPDQLCAHGPEGRFVHELVVPFVRRHDSAVASRPNGHHTHTLSPAPLRRFTPGSQWLYAKLYTGTATADRALREVVGPVSRAVQPSGAADRWFFIRYADPDWHLRVRFHGDPERLHTEVLPALQNAAAPLLDDGRLWRMQFDTYEREVERYGGAEGIELAERLFHADSEAVLAIVEMLAGDAGADARWRLALRGIDMLLTDLGFDPQTRRAVARRVRDDFAREFRVDVYLKRQLGDRFRKERKDLEALLDPARDAHSILAPGFAVLRRRSERLAPLVCELQAAERRGQLSASLADLARSYAHMHVNRLLRSAQRAQEMVLYDFLDRLYESRAARARRGC